MRKHRDGKTYITPELTALLCGTTTVSLRNWREQEHPPPYNIELNMYPAEELGVWIRTELIFKRGRGGSYPNLPDLSRFPSKVLPTGPDAPVTKQDADIRLKTLQADKLEIELMEKAGELIAVEDVTTTLSSMIVRVKTRLLRMPSAIAPTVAGMSDTNAVQKRLEAEVREALDELSEDWQSQQEPEQEQENRMPM
jgi:hypothetical protein